MYFDHLIDEQTKKRRKSLDRQYYTCQYGKNKITKIQDKQTNLKKLKKHKNGYTFLFQN